MAIRPQVSALILLGPFPPSADADAADIDRRGRILNEIEPPLTRAEAEELLGCFGPDEAFGLAWALVHLIETTRGGVPIDAEPAANSNEWIHRLWKRSHP